MSSASDAILEPAVDKKHVRLIGWGFALGAVPAFALLALAMGKEASWDFENYHWYDPYAFLNGRLTFDTGVAHHATYYNPILDVPLYWLGSRFPAWVAGAWLGALAGLAAAILGGIAYRVLDFPAHRTRLSASALLGLAGLTGGGALTEIGATPNDIGSGIGALASILVLVSRFGAVVQVRRRDLLVIALAGFLAGASPGLKLTTVPYAIGLGLAMLTLPGPVSRRIARALVFGIGILVGMAVFGGDWFWTMWRFSGNPVFPYFNDLFASPLVPPGSYRDATFLPADGWTRLIFPFVFSLNPLLVGEWRFQDIHVLLAYILVPLAAVSALITRPPGQRLVHPTMARLLLVAAAGTYVSWLFLFAIYRYLIPLEMLSPIVIAASVSLLPLKASLRLALTIVLLGVAASLAQGGGDQRLGWKGHYVDVDVPPLPDPAHTMILMTGFAPMAYVIPSFPPEIPFLRIQGYLIKPDDHNSGLGRQMHERVAKHEGPLYLLHWPREQDLTLKAVADYGLAIDEAGCRTVNTNLADLTDQTGRRMNQDQPIQLCPLTRISP
jgi:hypothetical protein